MVLRPTHEPSHPRLMPQSLNLWFAKFNAAHPNYANNCFRACRGTVLSWERMFVLAAVRSERFKKTAEVDFFGTGYLGADFAEQLTNAVAVWEATADMGDLRLDEASLQAFDALWVRWVDARTAMLATETELPAPTPPPAPRPMPLPPPPAPEPAQPEPAKPEEPNPSTPPAPWKSKFKWLGMAASLALNLYFLWGNLVPPIVGSTIKVLLEALKGVFS